MCLHLPELDLRSALQQPVMFLMFVPLLASMFFSPAFAVAGLLLAGLPILIHILNRRRFRTVDWAAMEFLLRAMRKNRKRLRFEQWLLLATRCLVLALLGLALARPLSCSDTSLAAVGQKVGLHVFILDNSYSTAYEAERPDARTHFEHEKHLVKQLIDQLAPGGESVAVITAGRPATAVLAKPTYDLQQARLAVERVHQSFGATDLPAQFGWRWASGTKMKNRRIRMCTCLPMQPAVHGSHRRAGS